MRIGILGGTGPAGKALAARLASAGFEVIVGSRSRDRARDTVDGLLADWPDRGLQLTGGENAEAAAAEVVVVATPWDSATQTAASLADSLRGKVVVSMANALIRLGRPNVTVSAEPRPHAGGGGVGPEFQPLLPARGSVAGNVQAALPDARVAAAFHHVPAKELGDLRQPVESDVLICSDHSSAVEVTSEIVAKLPNMRPLQAGGLAMATPIESFTAVLLQLNVNYKTRVALKLTGLPPNGAARAPADTPGRAPGPEAASATDKPSA